MVIDATNKPHAEIAVAGKIKLIHDHDEYWDRTGKGKDYISPILESPTWKEILKKAEEAVQTTGDFIHIFLENIHEMSENTLLALGTADKILPIEEGVKIFRLSFGS